MSWHPSISMPTKKCARPPASGWLCERDSLRKTCRVAAAFFKLFLSCASGSAATHTHTHTCNATTLRYHHAASSSLHPQVRCIEAWLLLVPHLARRGT